MKKSLLRNGLLFSLVILFVLPLPADEGMWLFNMLPTDVLEAKYGFVPPEGWVDHIRLSSIRFGGASASFVSSHGLVLTNHHVGASAIQNLSTKERDLMQSGFYARTPEEELPCPGIELWVLENIMDVTGSIREAEKEGMSPAQAAEARQKVIAGLEKEQEEKTGLRGRVVTLYSGGLYHLYAYKVYSDVRLVFAPEYAVAFFGGDPENFTYPRHDLDFSFFRVYENGKPISSPLYLPWSLKPLSEGDLIFCSGNPGSTGRLLTLAQLEFLRDINYPFALANLERRLAVAQSFSQRGDEQARIALRTVFGLENSLKAIKGYQSGLLDESLMAKKAREEKDLREAVAADQEMNQEFGQAWEEIAEAQKEYAELFKAYSFFERGQGFNTVYFNLARNLVRMTAEKGKPNGERLREYQDSNQASLRRSVLSSAPIYDEWETVKLADSLAQLKEVMGDYAEVRLLLADRTPEEVAAEWISKTKLKDLEIRKKYMEGNSQDVYLSEDPMIKAAWLVDSLSREIRAKHDREVESVETRNGTLIARALFKMRGASVPPDATSTLRLSFGVVKGYVEDGKTISFQTDFAGLFEKSDKNNNIFPYALPQRYFEKKLQLDQKTPLNFVATCDSIGGNSGSPVVNRDGELVGVLFDGNIQSLPTRFVYTEEISRSVMVHVAGILEALRQVYDAAPLIEEILGKE